jgi:hypothetical protein
VLPLNRQESPKTSARLTATNCVPQGRSSTWSGRCKNLGFEVRIGPDLKPLQLLYADSF